MGPWLKGTHDRYKKLSSMNNHDAKMKRVRSVLKNQPFFWQQYQNILTRRG
jgi:hypothetical protein